MNGRRIIPFRTNHIVQGVIHAHNSSSILWRSQFDEIQGAAVVASVEKNVNKNHPPINVPSVFAVAVIIVPIQTPKHPTKIRSRRSLQSDIQMKSAPTYLCVNVKRLALRERSLPSGRH